MEDAQGGLIADSSPQAIVSARTFTPVTAKFLLENWARLQEVSAPVFEIKARVDDDFYVGPADLADLQALSESGDRQNYVVPTHWLAPNKSAQVSLGWDRDPFFVRWRALLEMMPEERVKNFRQKRLEFETKIREERDPVARAKLIAAVTETAFLVNKACMSLEKTRLDQVDHDLVHETILVIQSVLSTIEESQLASSLLLTLRSLSTGQTVDHVVRVFATASAFLLYLRKLHSNHLVARMRSTFAQVYKPYYRRLLPRVSDGALTADNLVRLRGISMDEVREFSLGILLHDLGKTMDLAYFEGPQAYDAARVRQHVLLGSGLFLRTYGQKYEAARYIIGDHHNYLFHPDGYGLTRWDRSRGGGAAKKPECCVGATLEGFQSGETLTFLPIEVCAVVDVYDALTDPYRTYQKARDPQGAVGLMTEEFVAQGKMDPVIFDLFVGFLKAMGIDLPQLGFEERQASRTPWN